METTYAYLAGIIDADGYILIRRVVRSGRGKDGAEEISYIPIIGISRNAPAIPDFFQTIFPARRRQYQSKKPKALPVHWWEAERGSATEPLRCILSHLRIKNRQAALTLSILDLLNQTGRPSADQWAARQRLYEEVAQLNGPRPSHRYSVYRRVPQPESDPQ